MLQCLLVPSRRPSLLPPRHQPAAARASWPGGRAGTWGSRPAGRPHRPDLSSGPPKCSSLGRRGGASCLAGSGWLARRRLGTSVTCLYDCTGIDPRLVTMVESTPVTILGSEGANVGCEESRRGAAARLPLARVGQLDSRVPPKAPLVMMKLLPPIFLFHLV